MKKPLKKNAGGEASTMDFIVRKSNGGDVSRGTLPPKLPPGVQRAVDKAQGSRTVLPVPGAGEARQFLSGFVGASPDYSVMDPNYKELGKSYRAGEQASVASEVFGAMTPFATASALAKTRQIPSVSQLIAYHGTPKSEIFRAFDPKYIKTGEGNTQYGYGFYFAENPQVSGTYKRMESEYKRMTGGLDPKTERAYDFMAQGLSEPEILSRLGYYYGSELSFDDAMKAVNQAKQHFNVGRLYKVDIDDAKIAKMLDWDAPLGEQSMIIQNLAKQYKLNPDDLGGDLVHAMKAKTPEGAKLMSEAGVPGIKYLDQGSRGLPQIKKQFLDELDPDASTEEVMDLLGKKVFSAKNEALLRELNNNDWLGFDYPSQAISEVFRAGFFRSNPDITEGLKKAVSAARQPDKGTRNIVVFPGEESSIKMLEVDGAPIEKKHGGEVSTKDFIAKFAQGSPNPDEVPSVIDERDEIRSESQRMLNRLKAQGPRSTGFGNLPPGVAALKRDIEQRQIDAAKPGSAATMPLIDRPGLLMASDIIRGGTGTTPVEPTNPSEANRLMQALTGAYLPTAPVVRMGQSAKAAVRQPRATAASVKRGVEELGDTAADQLARLSKTNALGSQAGILRAPGGYFPTSRTPTAMIPGRSISNLDEAFDPVLQEVKKIRDPEARQALTTLFNQKAKDFFTKQAGSIDDPLREAILSGEIKFPEGSPKNMGDRFATRLQEGVAAGDLQSLRILNKEYDDMIGIKSVVPRRAGAPEVQDVVRSQIMAHIRDNLDKIPDAQLLAYADKKPVPRSKAMLAYAELTPQEKARYSGIQSYRVAKAAEEVRQKLKENPTLFSIILEPRIARTVFEQSKNVSDIDMARFPKISGGPSVENLVSPGMQTPEFGGVVPPGYFLPELETAINKGQPIFDLSSTNANFLRLLGMSPEELLRQARQIPVKELNKTSFPDFVKKAYANFQQLSQYEASLPKIKKNIEAGKAPPSDAMLYGVENFLPTNDGFRWIKVVKPDAVKAIASGMNNSVGSYATSTTYGSLSKGRLALENGEVEIYSLYDKNNVPHMTVEYLTQKASHSDPKLKTSDLKNSIMQFTGNGPLTGNKLPSEEYRAQVIDLVKKLNPQRVPTHIQKMVNSL